MYQSNNLNKKDFNDLPETIRSGKHARLLELNLSKMLLRLPKAHYFCQKNKEPDPYENMILISSVTKRKNHSVANTINKNNNQSLVRILPFSQNNTSAINDDNLEPQLSHVISQVVVTSNKISKNFNKELKNRYNCKKIYCIRNNLQQNDKEKVEVNFAPKSPKIALPDLNQQRKQRGPLLIWDPIQLKTIKSQSYIIMEYPSQKIILMHQSFLNVQIASLTKIMTFYVVYKIIKEKKIDPSLQFVQICHTAASLTGTSAQIQEGQEYTLEQLLYGLMLPSGNDAATSLAIWGGSYYTNENNKKNQIKNFVEQMNVAAKQLGLNSSRYCNPHGLPHPQAKGTALQVAKLSCICLSIQLFRKIVQTKFYRATIQNKITKKQRLILWQNTNKLLRRKGFIGIKTGITVTAGPCLTTAYNFKGITYVTVVLRAPKVSGRFNQTRKLLHWTLNKIHAIHLDEADKKILKALKRKNDDDSDYSEDQHQFKYNVKNHLQYKKRCNVLQYEM